MDVLELSVDQLRSLGDVLRRTETNIVLNRGYDSQVETRKQLDVIEGAYSTAVQLLDDGDQLQQQYAGTPKASAAHDRFEIIRYFTNFSLQSLRNFHLRLNYISKVADFAKNVKDAIEALDINDAAAVEVFAKTASAYRNSVMELTRLQQTASSRAFSMLLKEQGIGFDALVDRYKIRNGHAGPFEELTDEAKVQVYGDIISASGRGKFTVNVMSTTLGVGSIAVLLATAAMVVWDVVSSAHPVEAAVSDAVQLAAGVGGATLGEIVGAAAAVDADASPGFIFMAGALGAIGGAVLIGEVVGLLLAAIFTSGTSTLSVTTYVVYVAPLPDGRALARQLVHG